MSEQTGKKPLMVLGHSKTTILFNNEKLGYGGFDLRDCPNPEKLTSFIIEACNSYYESQEKIKGLSGVVLQQQAIENIMTSSIKEIQRIVNTSESDSELIADMLVKIGKISDEAFTKAQVTQTAIENDLPIPFVKECHSAMEDMRDGNTSPYQLRRNDGGQS